MGKSTIFMAIYIYNSKLLVYQRVTPMELIKNWVYKTLKEL